mgnify:FL=1
MLTQKISKNICSNLVEIGPLVVNICKENKGKTEKRRENAITQKLAQDYLQSKDTIDMFKSHTNGWVA